MKRHSTCVIGRLQIKTDDPTHLLKWIKSKTLIISKADKNVEKQHPFSIFLLETTSHFLLVGIENKITTVKNSLAVCFFLKKAFHMTQQSHSPDSYPITMKIYVHTKICTRISIGVLFLTQVNE